jgi:hypothetical protein
MNSPYGYEEKTKHPLDNEIVTCILLERSYPSKYLKELKKHNDEFGTEIQPSVKEGGISFHGAIILRRGTETMSPTEKVFLGDDNALELPSYNAFFTIQALPPKILFENKNDSQHKTINDFISKYGKPMLTNVLPSAYPCKKNFDDKFDAETIIKEHPELVVEYAEILQEDALRKREWQTIINAWETWSEEKCENVLLSDLSRRYGIGNIEGNKIIFQIPGPGLTFQVKFISYKGMINLKVYEYRQDAKGYNVPYFFTILNTNEDLKLAIQLNELRKKKIIEKEESDTAWDITELEGEQVAEDKIEPW